MKQTPRGHARTRFARTGREAFGPYWDQHGWQQKKERPWLDAAAFIGLVIAACLFMLALSQFIKAT